MSDWSVFLEAESDDDGVSLDRMEDLIDAGIEHLEPYSPSATYSVRSYSFRLWIDAANAKKAVEKAVPIVQRVARRVGLPPWDITTIQVLEEHALEAELNRPSFPELVGAAEVAKLLGVSRQRAAVIVKREDFPQPAATIAAGPVWLRSAVEAFEMSWPRRTGRPPKIVDGPDEKPSRKTWARTSTRARA